MLSSVLVDIYHLKRIHMVVNDKNLADVLKSKIRRLNLQPAVAELQRQREIAASAAAAGAATFTTSPPTSSQRTSSAVSGRRRGAGGGGAHGSASALEHTLPSSTRGDALDHTFAQTDTVWTTLPDPPSIGFLLECIAYFDLGTAPVTTDALELARAALPFMSSTLACTTLAACCALRGDAVSAAVMPLLQESLADPSSDTSASPSLPQASGGAPRTHHGLLHGGSITLRFIEALRRVGVTREDVWMAVAEHCVRCLPTLEGKDVVHLVELFYEQRMLCYPDLYAAVESHIATQMRGAASLSVSSSSASRLGSASVPYMSPSQLQQILFFYHELGQPTHVLQSLTAQSYEGRGFESALDVAATQSGLIAPRPHATLFTARLAVAATAPADGRRDPSQHRHNRDAQQTSESVPTAAQPTGDSAQVGSAAAHDAQQREQFLARASALLLQADPQELVELVAKCAAKHVMHASLMRAAVTRVVQLYFPDGVPVVSDRTAIQLPSPLRTEQSQQVLLTTVTQLLRFEDPSFFADCRQTLSGILDVMASEAAVLSLRNLSLAYGACTLLPPPATGSDGAEGGVTSVYRPPVHFFEAVMEQLRRTRDVAAHENHARLLQLVRTLLALESLGGLELLVQHLPSITVAATNAPRAVQVELLASLASLPEAARGLVPTLLIALGPVRDKPTWFNAMTPGEVRVLLTALVDSRAFTGGVPARRDAQGGRTSSPSATAFDGPRQEEGVATLTLASGPGTSRGGAAVLPESSSSTAVDGISVGDTTAAAAALMTGIVAFIKAHKARFPPSELTQHLHTLARLGYRELDFFASTAEHLLNVAAYTDASASSRGGGVDGRRRGGAALGHVPTSVHDLSVLLYVFTYLLCGVIRVTQQIMARLKVSLSHATPRDISLILYSLVRLNVPRPRELGLPLCDRAVVVLTDFTPAELASVWSSLRALGCATDGFLQATKALLGPQAMDAKANDTAARSSPEQRGSGTTPPPPPSSSSSSPSSAPLRLSSAQRLAITAAVVTLSRPTTAAASHRDDGTGRLHGSISAATSASSGGSSSSGGGGGGGQRRGRRDSLITQLSLMSSRVLQDARDAAPAPSALFASAHALADDAAVQEAFKSAAVRVARTRQLSGLQLTLAVTTLAAMPLATLTSGEWSLLAVQADRLCHSLGARAAASGDDADTLYALGAAEVLIALCQLHARTCPEPVDAPHAPWDAVTQRWAHLGGHGGGAAGDAGRCPVPPQLARYVGERVALIAAAPLLREPLRPILAAATTEMEKGPISKPSSSQEGSAATPTRATKKKKTAKPRTTHKRPKVAPPAARDALKTRLKAPPSKAPVGEDQHTDIMTF